MNRRTLATQSALAAAAVWCGLHFGPFRPRPQATPETARTAAQEFVQRTADAKRRQEGEPPVTLTFMPQGMKTERDAADPALWQVAGDAEMDGDRLRYQVTERWGGDGVHQWRLKSIEIERRKQ